MKNKPLPVMFIAVVLLFILTGLTILFITDYYSAYGKNFTASIYGETNRSPLYGTKSFDAEATDFAISKERALEAVSDAEFYSKNAIGLNEGASNLQDTDPKTAEDGEAGSRPDPAAKSDDDIAKLYVVYSESLSASGGI